MKMEQYIWDSGRMVWNMEMVSSLIQKDFCMLDSGSKAREMVVGKYSSMVELNLMECLNLELNLAMGKNIFRMEINILANLWMENFMVKVHRT